MKRFRRILVAVVALLVAVVATACSNKSNSSKGGYTPKSLTIQFVPSQAATKLQARAKPLEKMLSNKPDKIILGCTHYPYLLDVLSEFAPREMFIDPSLFFAEFIKQDLDKNNLLSDSTQGSEEFFVSANPESFISASKVFYPLEKASLLKLQV